MIIETELEEYEIATIYLLEHRENLTQSAWNKFMFLFYYYNDTQRLNFLKTAYGPVVIDYHDKVKRMKYLKIIKMIDMPNNSVKFKTNNIILTKNDISLSNKKIVDTILEVYYDCSNNDIIQSVNNLSILKNFEVNHVINMEEFREYAIEKEKEKELYHGSIGDIIDNI